jgi:hypothetical protein
MGINKDHTPPIYLGYNKRREGPNFLPKLHSEVDSYNKAKGLLKGASFEVVNIRLNCSGELRISKPCPCCYSLLKALNCKAFFYSTENGFDKTK